ncbi:uncharacterized protein HMPREF1541_10856 [Cyphellophora europaea CBS 101466]|uniref:Zn(2)-C6 fungal-type domain-containing protein n=1 Tax=Cyphellophora europaea (strain CBS 101466) TaxID=1220924 RepID=W2S5K7_CYPE1|nr:uncharacterized protein HMPREF1541_10856 [Cyphellophora europaea CBS 101466]ETN43991.1 hypothetical protein HMPREF1541_10856 [Cyphellophora europaea CBS 101466]
MARKNARTTDQSLDSARKKSWKPKVKTGCVTCKNRRVKCDENKPDCRRCSATGRKCEGYRFAGPGIGTSVWDHPWAHSWTPHAFALGPDDNSGFFPPGSLLQQPSVFVFDTAEEQQSFEFFQVYSVPEFTALFPPDLDFWCYSVLPISMMQPAVRHAVASLGALHRHFVEGDEAILSEDAVNTHLGRFGLLQYTQALKSFTQLAKSSALIDKVLALITSILIIHISSLQGYQQSSFRHLDKALDLFQDLKAQIASIGGTSYAVQMKALHAILLSLQTQARTMNCSEDLNRMGPLDAPSAERFSRADLPHFASLNDARDYYDTLLNDLQLFDQNLGIHAVGPAEDKFQNLVNRLTYGEEALVRLRTETMLLRNNHSGTALTIQLNSWILDLFLRAYPRLHVEGELAWDTYHSHFAKIVQLSQQILGAPDVQPHKGSLEDFESFLFENEHSVKPIFTAGHGVLGPLFVVAMHCREPRLRREALYLLFTNPRREGLWDSISAARVALQALKLEERLHQDLLSAGGNTGMAAVPNSLTPRTSTIPRACRVNDLDIQYTSARTASLQLKTEGRWHQLQKTSIISW